MKAGLERERGRQRLRVSGDSKTCFAAGLVCFVVGGIGWCVNVVAAGTTNLHGLLVVAGFYVGMGLINLVKTSEGTDGKANEHDLEQECPVTVTQRLEAKQVA